MNNRFAKYVTTGVAAAALTVGLAFAQAGPGPAGREGRHPLLQQHFARMAQSLGLSDSQKEQAKTVFEQARQQAEPVRAQLQQNRQAIADAVKAGKSDAELQSLSTATGTLVGQLTAIHTQAMSKVYATLTPEQKEKAAQLHDQFKSRIQNFRGRRHSGE